MKKIFGLLAMIFVMGCDDGDMTFQSFDFTDATVRNCDDEIIYKVNGSEALVLELSPSSFVNVPTEPNTPRVVTISNTNRVTYLKYASDLGTNPANIICNALPPVSPSEIWASNGGTIEITTVANTDPDNAEIITGYKHTINLRSVSFTRNGETIVIENNLFGDYTTTPGYNFNFTATTLTLRECPETAVLYITNQNEALRMMLNNDVLFVNDVTAPRTQQINEENKVFFEIYDGTNLSQERICGEDLFLPPLIGKWEAYEGTVEVTTTEAAGVYEHHIRFINIRFRNTTNIQETFLRTNYVLGDTYIPAP